MKKHCEQCDKDLHIGFFNEQSGDLCVLCAKDVKVAEVQKKQAEIVEDKGCAGGACTL